MGVEYTSPGATRHFYGPRLNPATNPDPAGAKESRRGNVVELEIRYSYDNLPAYSASAVADSVVPKIPAGALVLSCRRYVEADFNSTSGTTVVDVGLTDTAGNVLDADGLIDSSVAADGSNAGWETGTVTADAGGTVGLSADAVVTVTPSAADLTAGRARVLIEYIPAAG